MLAKCLRSLNGPSGCRDLETMAPDLQPQWWTSCLGALWTKSFYCPLGSLRTSRVLSFYSVKGLSESPAWKCFEISIVSLIYCLSLPSPEVFQNATLNISAKFISFFLFSFSLLCLPGKWNEDAFEQVTREESLSESSYGVASVYVLKVMIYLRTQRLCEGDAASIHPALWLRMCSHGTATPFQHHATSEITNPSILGTLILSHGNNWLCLLHKQSPSRSKSTMDGT